MKRNLKKIFIIALIIVLTLTACETGTIQKGSDNTPTSENTSENKSENTFQEAEVVRAVDGDTIIVRIDGVDEKIRMVLVDTPESVHPRKPVEFFGKEASEYTKSNLEGKTVYLQKDVTDRDRYGRLLRYVWVARPETDEPTNEEVERLMYNAQLLKEGYANLATFPPDVKYVDFFRELEREARDNDRGLWNPEAQQAYETEQDETEKSKDELKELHESGEQLIKGNKKSMIYHIPGGKYYDSLEGDNIELFKTEDEAIAAGFRKSKQ